MPPWIVPGPSRSHDHTRPRPRLGDVEPGAVGGEPDAVRRVEREDDLADQRPIGACVEDAGAVPVALAELPVIGEPEAAVAIEHQVVRSAERAALTRGVEVRDLPAREVDA